MQNIRQQKTTLIRILSEDARFVLQYAQQAELITTREYNNLKDDLNSHSREDLIINLLDKLMQKGDKKCQTFLELLEHNEMQETFPLLNDLFIPPALREVVPVQETNETAMVKEYRMSSIPRGVCVIINNNHFSNRDFRDRKGTDMDARCLNEVFEWLGFSVEMYSDKTADEMKELLMGISQREHKGDCFVCCILSYGSESGFVGTDGLVIDVSDILKPFVREKCLSLAEKPKVFILHNDIPQVKFPIPDTDFLLAFATVPGLHSYRHTSKGTWFIQSFCKMLKEGCKSGEDIFTIFGQVIEEVSDTRIKEWVWSRQIPHLDFTLRKRLVFHVPDPAPHPQLL